MSLMRQTSEPGKVEAKSHARRIGQNVPFCLHKTSSRLSRDHFTAWTLPGLDCIGQKRGGLKLEIFRLLLSQSGPAQGDFLRVVGKLQPRAPMSEAPRLWQSLHRSSSCSRNSTYMYVRHYARKRDESSRRPCPCSILSRESFQLLSRRSDEFGAW